MTMETQQMPKPTENSSKIIDKTQKKLPIYTYSMNELEKLRFVNQNEQKMRWRDVYESLESDVAKEYDGLKTQDLPDKKKKKKKKKKLSAESKVIETMEHDVGYERGSDDWISNSRFCNREIRLFVQDNGVQMEDKGLIVDALQESVYNITDVGEKIDDQRSMNRKLNEGEKVFGNSKVLSYSRSEMEALRFVNVEEQERWWKEVHHNLGSDIVKELDGLRAASNWKQERSRNDVDKQSAKKKADLSNHLGIKTTEDPDVLNICDDIMDCSGEGIDIEEPLDEYDNVDEDDSSSDEYGSIQRPAFLVEGEPDFESGPPLDGLEYLRRVRWEAAHIPKVKVVKLDSSKFTSEQTAYMPSIPCIPRCPSKLLPSGDWENAFLAEFSELRQAISTLEESSSTEPSLDKASQSHSRQSNNVEQLKKNAPTLTTILGMDASTRAARLRNYVSSLESINRLSKEDCLWLFALCAAVDTPLHADTCASLRCLLRKCSSILVMKSGPDDEVAMLSILIAVTGKYFGQLESYVNPFFFPKKKRAEIYVMLKKKF